MKDKTLELGDLFNVLPDTIIVVDGDGRIVFANTAISGLLAYSADELIGQSLSCLIPENFRMAHESYFADFHDGGKPASMGDRPLLSALHKSGKKIPVSISIANFDSDGERYSVAVMRDGGKLHSEITRASVQAETDVLTGIGNRLQLSRELQSALVSKRPFGLLFLDLKKFKSFNDNHGHALGDKVLQIVARRLLAQIRYQDLAARIGGDEFVVVLAGIARVELLEQRANSIARNLNQPFHIGDLSSSVEVNIGGAIYPQDSDTEEGLLEVADRNMYRAKQFGLAYYVGRKA